MCDRTKAPPARTRESMGGFGVNAPSSHLTPKLPHTQAKGSSSEIVENRSVGREYGGFDAKIELLASRFRHQNAHIRRASTVVRRTSDAPPSDTPRRCWPSALAVGIARRHRPSASTVGIDRRHLPAASTAARFAKRASPTVRSGNSAISALLFPFYFWRFATPKCPYE